MHTQTGLCRVRQRHRMRYERAADASVARLDASALNSFGLSMVRRETHATSAAAALGSIADSTTAGAADTNSTAALSEGSPVSTAFDEAASACVETCGAGSTWAAGFGASVLQAHRSSGRERLS